MYSENETLALPLNPTYVDIRILFSNPRLIIKLTLHSNKKILTFPNFCVSLKGHEID